MCLLFIVRVQSEHVYVGPGFVSMSPASRRSVDVSVVVCGSVLGVLFPGLGLASVRLDFGACHSLAREQEWAAEKTAVLGPPFGGRGCFDPIWAPVGAALQPRAGRKSLEQSSVSSVSSYRLVVCAASHSISVSTILF